MTPTTQAVADVERPAETAATLVVRLSLPGRSWSQRLLSLPMVQGLALVSMLFFFSAAGGKAVHALADPDIWWHLRDASVLVHTRHFLRADLYTYTVAGKPWINFEWMAELPYYFAWQAMGDRGLYLVMMLVAGAIVAGVYGLAWMRSGDPKSAFLASMATVLFATVSLGPRTLLFGWLFLVVELGVLWSFQRGRDHTIWLPLLFLLWINTHGSWFIGFVLMAVFVACGFVGGEWGSVYATRWTGAQARKLLGVMAASFALLFVNPYGWRLVAYPLDVAFGQKLTLEYVAEWASLDFHNERGKLVLLVLLLFGVLQLVRRRRWSLQDLAFALIAVYGAFTYVRFIFLAGIVVAPLLAMDLSGMLGPYEAKKDRRWPNAVAAALLLGVVAFLYPTEKQLEAGVTASYPAQAIPVVRSLAGQGRLFNEFNWGAYLEWNAPQVPEFVDSRVDIFVHEGILRDYVRVAKIQDPYAVLDHYGIRYALLARSNEAAYLLAHSADWKTIWSNPQGVLFERVR